MPRKTEGTGDSRKRASFVFEDLFARGAFPGDFRIVLEIPVDPPENAIERAALVKAIEGLEFTRCGHKVSKRFVGGAE